MNGQGRFWLSPGARLGFAGVIVLIVLLFAGLWFPQHATSVRQDRAEQVRVVAQENGAKLLHTYDCTYGNALREVLLQAERQARTAAAISLQSRHTALQQGDRKRAHAGILSRRNNQAAAAKYHQLRMRLKPLGRNFEGIPIPPCKDHR